MTLLRRFGAFWYDFLVGDRWELLLGPIACLVLTAVLVGASVPAAAVAVVLAISVILVGAGSVLAQLR